MSLSRQQQKFLYQFVIYVCAFLLFWEWLRPLEQITDTEDITIFIIYAGFCFFISFLQVSWWLSIPLKFLGLAFILDGLYLAERLFSKAWFTAATEQIQFNISQIFQQQWWEMTPFFRSLLFLILLWLMSYLLYYWFVVAKRMLFFVILTFIYVTVLDTFTVYDGKMAIVRTFIISLIGLGISSFSKEMDREEVHFKGLRKAHLWVLPLVLVIAFSSVVGYASPKLTPQWPDPVPFLTGGTGSGGFGNGGGIQKVGYGENDERLGGSFIQDESPVFQAATDSRRYWRIESKDQYTGKGWVNSLEPSITRLSNGDITYRTFTDEVETENQETIVVFNDRANLRKLVYPYGADELVRYTNGFEFEQNGSTGEIKTYRNQLSDNPSQIGNYRMTYDSPSFEYDQLREAGDDDPQEILDTYLQLPEDMPNRIRNLTEQIIEEEENRYDAVKEVEGYFSSNGFEYNTEDVAVPRENQDYVDQFIFETQQGYCDNFSTSMVVMLRSVDIPARWVKGFTGGERLDAEVELGEETHNFYEITNANAHSWVEVFFPGIGWVPFEPTMGFTNPTDFYMNTDDLESDEDQETNTPEDPMGQIQDFEQETEEDAAAAAGGSDQDGGNNWYLLVVAAVLTGIAILLYLTRFRWMSYYLMKKYKHKTDAKTYQQAYQFLLKALDKKGLKRAPDQTLREYAHEVDGYYQSRDMRTLTHHYERIIYRNDHQSDQWRKVTELWENLIKRTLS
ncbi:DUF4129 domain-containing transglutaminase family protein [Thalassobacillus hwangdonensis]|uniref:DUF4129 domain-containing transglutaminase family protein n=1 Tax=Thalassobacillus hwangdonensis TaxID=546108 RepID=A0ABW3L6B5_9BACI